MRVWTFALLLPLVATSAVAAPGQGTAATPAPETTQPPAEAARAAGHVARSRFTTDVVDREPVDSITTLTNDHRRIFFFAELRNLGGTTIVHRWEWNGTVVAEVAIEVGAPRWRAYSSKQLNPDWLGEWKVSIVDRWGEVLAERNFSYVEAEKTAPRPTPHGEQEMPANSADA
jgi:hypothetical protein